ncbi:uncharacterized protein METZ01_LOCUS234955, partial [marine metagenome]
CRPKLHALLEQQPLLEPGDQLRRIYHVQLVQQPTVGLLQIL